MGDFADRLNKPVYRYLLIGVSVYLIELLVIFLATRNGMSSVAAVALSFWIGLILSFLLQKVVTFRDHRTHHKIIFNQLLAFGLLVLFNFGFTILVTDLFSPSIPPAVSRTIAIAITTIWNFYLYKTKIFSKPLT